jgi:hypothetical protein
MITRFIELSNTATTISLPAGAQTWHVTGLAINLFNPSGAKAWLNGDGTADIECYDPYNVTTDGFYVDFSSPIPNNNWTLGYMMV